MAETKKVKIGDRHVASRYTRGGYSAGTVYELSEREAKEIVAATLGHYARGGQAGKAETPETVETTNEKG